MMIMDLMYEYDRINFVIQRDGQARGILYAKNLSRIYRETCTNFRKKYQTNHPLRPLYLRSAYSARYILRKYLTKK